MLSDEQVAFLDHRFIHFTSGCWEWVGCRKQRQGSNLGGYGLGHHPDTKRHGPISQGLQIDHLCRTRACVNPSHLEAVTSSENQQRAAALITHCPQGHPYDDRNTKIKRGRRTCRKCHMRRERIRQRRKALT